MKNSFLNQILSQHETSEAAVCSLRTKLESGPVDQRLNLQVLLNALGREAEAFAVSDELMGLAPRDARVLFNRGWHLINRGRLKDGLSLLEFGRPLKTYGHPPLNSKQPLWNKETGHGQTVILNLEGGLGDEIIHFRFVENLSRDYGCRVHVSCHPSLARVFSRSPYVSAILQREACGGILHDAWMPGMSAALALGLELKDLKGKAYLTPDLERVTKWQHLLGPRSKKLRVGVRWAGNPEFEHQQFRKFPAELLLNLKNLSGIELFSFQRDNDLVDLPSDVVDLGPWLKDWDDTVAAVMNMDLMISSCTSVAHMSAALGQKTWVIVPALPYFLWASPGNTSPWYDSVRLFRQKQFGSWDNVSQELSAQLQSFVAEKAITLH